MNGRNPAPKAAPAVPQQQVTVSAASQALLETVQPSRSAFLGSGLSPVATFPVKDGVVERCVGSECMARALPSGAKAVSAAASGRTVMAVDTEGNLFVSGDQCEHWEQAKVQWEGKAVSVGLPTVQEKAAKFFATPKASPAPVRGSVEEMKAPAPVVPPTFELTNDKGQVWVSADGGKTWVARNSTAPTTPIPPRP